jgi:hypothetical protein
VRASWKSLQLRYNKVNYNNLEISYRRKRSQHFIETNKVSKSKRSPTCTCGPRVRNTTRSSKVLKTLWCFQSIILFDFIFTRIQGKITSVLQKLAREKNSLGAPQKQRKACWRCQQPKAKLRQKLSTLTIGLETKMDYFL